MAFSKIKEFITTGDATPGTLLIPKLIMPPLIDAVDKALLPREMAAMVQNGFEGSSFSVNLVTPNIIKIRNVAEGAEIPLDSTSFTSVTFTPKKYGVGIRITREMMEDSQFNILEANLREVGRRFAENETNLILTALDGASTTVTGGAALTIANLTAGILGIHNYDYEPTDMVIGNEILQDLQNIDTFVEADKAGNMELMQKGYIGTIFGMKVAHFSTNAAPSVTYAKYAYLFDRRQAYGIAIKRDVTVENFMLPSCDMEAAAITMRIDVQLLRAISVAKITTA
jgi:HK97 family phage major capsid protein